MNSNLPAGVEIKTTKDDDGNVIAAKVVHKSKGSTKREDVQKSGKPEKTDK